MSDPAPSSLNAIAVRRVELQAASRLGRFDRRDLAEWSDRLLDHLSPGAGEAVLRLVGETEMRHLNTTYRGRDGVTDVLSFPGESTPDAEHLGDVAICLPVAERQAAVAGHSLDVELRVLILHGLLHCLGHDHETDDGEMESLESRLRAEWIAQPEGER